MQEKSKEEIIKKEELKKAPVEIPKASDKSAWENDQKERGYYYDDSHGYQKYIPEDDAEE